MAHIPPTEPGKDQVLLRHLPSFRPLHTPRTLYTRPQPGQETTWKAVLLTGILYLGDTLCPRNPPKPIVLPSRSWNARRRWRHHARFFSENSASTTRTKGGFLLSAELHFVYRLATQPFFLTARPPLRLVTYFVVSPIIGIKGKQLGPPNTHALGPT